MRSFTITSSLYGQPVHTFVLFVNTTESFWVSNKVSELCISSKRMPMSLVLLRVISCWPAVKSSTVTWSVDWIQLFKNIFLNLGLFCSVYEAISFQSKLTLTWHLQLTGHWLLRINHFQSTKRWPSDQSLHCLEDFWKALGHRAISLPQLTSMQSPVDLYAVTVSSKQLISRSKCHPR